MDMLLENSIKSKFDTIESKFGKADAGVQPPCATSMEIHISAILVKPVYNLDDGAHHLRDLRLFLVLYLFYSAFVCDDDSPVLSASRSWEETNFYIILQVHIDIPSICYELPGNIARCWARSLDEKDLHRHKGRQASREMLPDLLKGVSGKRPHQTVVKADRPSSSFIIDKWQEDAPASSCCEASQEGLSNSGPFWGHIIFNNEEVRPLYRDPIASVNFRSSCGRLSHSRICKHVS
ncbi:unnamed protein product [Clonostachys chloroleuca]|uniref:Uncharacterized protein n=1 Tax=Clonostachys chloroleuca TaxID=1926264 RepID=A0AA35MHK8_9HYPO|nr:unnamed protein product [Clonostachys chloroleuca]